MSIKPRDGAFEEIYNAGSSHDHGNCELCDALERRLAEAERCGHMLAMRLLQSSEVLDDRERAAQDFFLQKDVVKRVLEMP